MVVRGVNPYFQIVNNFIVHFLKIRYSYKHSRQLRKRIKKKNNL